MAFYQYGKSTMQCLWLSYRFSGFIANKYEKENKKMPGFGFAGKITVGKARTGAVLLHPEMQQYLYFSLTVNGGTPIFNFGRDGSKLIRAESFGGHPKQVYQWTLGRKITPTDPSEELLMIDPHLDDHMYGIGMEFFHALKYTLRVEHRDRDDNVIELLKDVEFESNDSRDFFRELLEVRIP